MPEMLFASPAGNLTGPLCEWCGGERRPTQKATCSAPCRAGRWRWLNNVTRAGGLPPESPPWPESPLHGRMGAGARSNSAQVGEAVKPGPRSGAKARSGLILSYPKAVTAAQDALVGYVMASGCNETEARAEIEQVLRGALSTKMRRKLEARGGH